MDIKNGYDIVIGLEVHVQPDIKTKAFCGCEVSFGAMANSKVCPVCLGLPGSLPVLNKKALEYAIKVALALNCKINPITRFDRKNYFYPDLPKNFQISQYDLPLSYEGWLKVDNKKIGIKRVHLEEDAGKLIHEQDNSLVDYNRAGTSLLEIVSMPDITSPDEAYQYLVVLKSVLSYLEVSTCDMEKGTLRCDANISLKKIGAKELGTKAEIKNLNSFKAVKLALEYEVMRQAEVLDKKGIVVQETRLWDAKRLMSISMRSKEEAQDYRYFPEPDLPLFVIENELIERLHSEIPVLAEEKKNVFIKEYGLSEIDAGILSSDKDLADYFEDCLKLFDQPKKVCNWLIGALLEQMNERNISSKALKIKPIDLVDLIQQVEMGVINNLTAKNVLSLMFETLKTPNELIKENNLAQISDTKELEEFAKKVIAENKKSVDDYASGKTNALMFLVGQMMRLSKGKANPKVVAKILEDKIKQSNNE